MPGEMMRARHAVFGVTDVPRTAHYLDNGWTEVDLSTPLTVDERRRSVNELRAGDFDPAEHKAAEVAAVIEAAPDEDKAAVIEAEKAGKARKTVINQD